MNSEFHYDITYLIALKAGFKPKQAHIISYSSQFVDDNNEDIIVRDGAGNSIYRSTPTQIKSISDSQSTILVLSTYHFLAENPLLAENSVTKPDCWLARKLLKQALQKGNPYLIGIASHSYVDTWAHQNFNGYKSELNHIPGGIGEFMPNWGHADALFEPDILDAIWHDSRFPDKVICNHQRFLEAATHLYQHFCDSQQVAGRDLIAALSAIFLNNLADSRLQRRACSGRRKEEYQKLALEYSGLEISNYDLNLWKQQALTLCYLEGCYIWSPGTHTQDHHWWHFQEAAKTYRNLYLKAVESFRRSGSTAL